MKKQGENGRGKRRGRGRRRVGSHSGGRRDKWEGGRKRSGTKKEERRKREKESLDAHHILGTRGRALAVSRPWANH